MSQYFVMPAIFDSLIQNRHLTAHVAWRVSFIVPFIIITAVALGIIFLGEDTPTGSWATRHHVGETFTAPASPTNSIKEPTEKPEKLDAEANNEVSAVDTAEGEVIVAPTFQEAMSVLFSLQTLALAGPYACAFGGELAINSILGSYYLKNFPKLGQTGAGRWAAMFGLLNVVFRPLGGVVSDLIYKYTGSIWGKKGWLVFCGIMLGCFEIAIGLTDSKQEKVMFGLVAGLAVFMDAANGANFAIVPHVHPFANGILSGFVGAAGNLGGIIFAIVFRYNGVHYNKAIWIIGAISIGVNVACSWIRPLPKGQVGGR
jgi:NNP family nitrate/nitrite transporter-like MFS transporter